MRAKAFFINGGAGRVLSSIPALENYQKENPGEDFIIVCEGGTDFFKGHVSLYDKVYDNWHKNLFHEKIVNMDVVTPEPYRVWEYYNQKCSLAQGFDIEINGKGVRELQRPTLKLSQDEIIAGKTIINEVRQVTKKDKVVVFQPFGRGVQVHEQMVNDPSGRSFEAQNVIEIIKKLQKNYAVVLMSEIGMDFAAHGCKDPVAHPQNVSLRQWAGVIRSADYFLGCDSVGQHIAYAVDKPCTVVVGSTFAVNVSYPDVEKMHILDMGEGLRKYSPIRITMDEVADRTNDGIMMMNDKIEDVIVESVNTNLEKYYVKPADTLPPMVKSNNIQCCPTPQVNPSLPGAPKIEMANK